MLHIPTARPLPARLLPVTALFVFSFGMAQARALGTPTTTATPGPGTVVLTSSLNPSTFAQPVTLTAAVPSPSGAAPPTGTVSFYDGSQSLGQGRLSSGQATLTLNTLSTGTHALTAAYSGDAGNAAARPAVLAQTVSPIATDMALTTNGNSALGAAVTLTATVTRKSAALTWLTGSVTFRDGGKVLATVPIKNGGAILTTNSLSAGNHRLQAAYSGDAHDAPSASPDVQEHIATTGVMPMGDSITWGAQSLPTGGYRGPLWQMTVGQGWDAQSVGSVYAGPPEIGGCEGHGGWTIEQIQGIVPTVLPEYQPKIVLLQIGTNDSFLDGGTSALTKMTALLDTLRTTAPDTLVFVASLTPCVRPAIIAQGMSAFDQALPSLVQAEVAEGGRFQFVDMHTLCGFGTGDLSSDGTHPSPAGYQKMADVWYNVLVGQSSVAHPAP